MTATPDETLEQAYRAWFGRLVGWLFRMTGDLQLAEDSVSSAFASALPAWRASGAPDSPEAWLRVAARNHAMSSLRRVSRTSTVPPEHFTEMEHTIAEAPALDDRLGLLLVCAHPAIDPRLHAPLMLQAVLGVDAARIASVYLVSPTTMGQRLSRAKAKIRDAGIRFVVPETDQLAPRLGAVLQAIYGAYGLSDPSGEATDDRDSDIRLEAVRLAHLLTQLLPREPETWGLYALLLHTESRRPARVVEGRFVPLAEQDTALWSPVQRRSADESLIRASRLEQPGRFQLEAAISAIHSSRGHGLATDWESIVVLYQGLLSVAPSIGATIGAAGALLQLDRADDALQLLNSLPPESVASHQPYWVCRARVLHHLSAPAEAASARAIGLTSDPAVRRYLLDTLPNTNSVE